MGVRIGFLCVLQEHRAHADALREEMRFKYAEAQRANDRGDHRLATELRERVSGGCLLIFLTCSQGCLHVAGIYSSWHKRSASKQLVCVGLQAHQARMRYLQADKVASKKILKETCVSLADAFFFAVLQDCCPFPVPVPSSPCPVTSSASVLGQACCQ